MPKDTERADIFTPQDHQVAFIFDPVEDGLDEKRPSKRRRVSDKQVKSDPTGPSSTLFPVLLNGVESHDCVRTRQAAFEHCWARVHGKIQDVLDNANTNTLEQVDAFVEQAASECVDAIPAAFIITGPNIALQDLLFEQLAATLTASSRSLYVRLTSAETPNLKATLKKIVRAATTGLEEDGAGEDAQIDGRQYLDYDLEALHAHVRSKGHEHVFVAFQDSEGFDGGLLSETIYLLNSWRPRIPFTLLFGVATSVELLQGRLLKSACRLVHGAQFDIVQTSAILEAVIRAAVAAVDVPLQIGPYVLSDMMDRQQDHMTGIQAFVGSLKYAYMCHFYAHPLSFLATSGTQQSKLLQPEHVEALRNLPSFRAHIEDLANCGDKDSAMHARRLLEDDGWVRETTLNIERDRTNWRQDLMKGLLVMEAAGAQTGKFSSAFADALSMGLDVQEDSRIVNCVRRMNADDLDLFLVKVMDILHPDKDKELLDTVKEAATDLKKLQAQAKENGHMLRSKYSEQSKVTRTTVIAQRVQLSRDSAALREEDEAFTELVDSVTEALRLHIQVSPASKSTLFCETWLYDSKQPMREVSVPRPRATFERSLTRPHDYLGCTCCSSTHKNGNAPEDGEDGENEEKGAGVGIRSTLPTTSILHQLYLETGNLINVADLWAAFQHLTEDRVQGDEKQALFLFYRGLAELKSMGYIKPSKKKADHVAKVKWL